MDREDSTKDFLTTQTRPKGQKYGTEEIKTTGNKNNNIIFRNQQ